VFVLFLLLLVFAVPALAAPESTEPERPWATVNICDTAEHPNVLGVRASMPGNGTRQTMWMRFRASYFDRGTEQWRDVAGASRSPWVKVGNARFANRQAGRTFKIAPPAPTTSHVVRGVVSFRWRRKNGEIARRVQKVTLAGHPTGRHGDPNGYSAGLCEITFP